MATKFFNNENGDTLFAKLKGIVGGMGANFHAFQAVSGYFRSSGYFKLRNELKDTQKIQVLVGIDIDNVFRKSQREGMMFFGDKEDAKRQYTKAFVYDIRRAAPAPRLRHLPLATSPPPRILQGRMNKLREKRPQNSNSPQFSAAPQLTFAEISAKLHLFFC